MPRIAYLSGRYGKTYESLRTFVGINQHGVGEKSEALMKVLDTLNARYGRNTVSIASLGVRHSWTMRRECMSPDYTTKWSDVPVAQAC